MVIRAPVTLKIMLGAVALVPLSAPASAQSMGQLDSLLRQTATSASGIALARQQTSSGALTDALATLERVILSFPRNDEARLLHASLLCRLDDRRGSLVEFDNLRGHAIPDALWQEATQPCGGK